MGHGFWNSSLSLSTYAHTWCYVARSHSLMHAVFSDTLRAINVIAFKSWRILVTNTNGIRAYLYSFHTTPIITLFIIDHTTKFMNAPCPHKDLLQKEFITKGRHLQVGFCFLLLHHCNHMLKSCKWPITSKFTVLQIACLLVFFSFLICYKTPLIGHVSIANLTYLAIVLMKSRLTRHLYLGSLNWSSFVNCAKRRNVTRLFI